MSKNIHKIRGFPGYSLLALQIRLDDIFEWMRDEGRMAIDQIVEIMHQEVDRLEEENEESVES